MQRIRHLTFLAALAGSVFTADATLAVNPDEMLSDPVLEARAREISKGLRCVMCRNQNIDDSNASIARDMRIILRERLAAGDTDEEAAAFIVDRFGVYVLLQPPVSPTTYALWGGPAVLLGLMALGFSRRFRKSGLQEEPEELSEEDRALVDSLLAEKGSTQ